MTIDQLLPTLTATLHAFAEQGTRKGEERVITGIKMAANGRGPRYLLAGQGDQEFLRMNSNSYLDLALHPAVLAAEAEASHRFGTGPGAVRFIGGTYEPHLALEKQLARFHKRPAAILFSAAYAGVIGVLPCLITPETMVASDALNHNSIINAIRLSRPRCKVIYPHGDMEELERILEERQGQAKRVLVVTDGIFSMRGDGAPLAVIEELSRRYAAGYEEGIITVVDDSHGVGACGARGRGTEEESGGRADLLIGTLGKALGVNGGYAVGAQVVIDLLRESAASYIFSNPISPGEAAAARTALEIIDRPEGIERLQRLRALRAQLGEGLASLGFESIPGRHPIVPLLIRDRARTRALMDGLFTAGILTTGLNYPVVPKGEEEIRLQLNAGHTATDIDYLLANLAKWAAITPSRP